ncbi:MAG: hypothetical protein GX751_10230, partial [Desulfuromonadaceae bacterium]|nr:hypothetical protein [Desulfuromonadaceae bacterium]
MAMELFGARTKGYALGIRGYQFDEYEEKLSPKAQVNLEKTIEFIAPLLRKWSFPGG